MFDINNIPKGIEAVIAALDAWGVRVHRRDLVVAAGGAVVLMGLRAQTSDLDLEVSPEIWSELRLRAPKTAFRKEGSVHICTPVQGVDMHRKVHHARDLSLARGHRVEGVTGHSRAYLETGGSWADGGLVWCASIPATVALKRRLNRQKDQADLAALTTVQVKVSRGATRDFAYVAKEETDAAVEAQRANRMGKVQLREQLLERRRALLAQIVPAAAARL